jgi:catechol 2,3-dioxygenase-like lactoylglutathione lyase family enzyme
MQALAAAAAVTALPAAAEAAGAFKPTWVSHYTYVAPDLKKTSEWYAEVLGMQVGHKDAKQVHLWYSDQGNDSLMIVRQANAGEDSPRLEKFAFTIQNFDKNAVEAGLKRLGLSPKSDDRGFWFNDVDGNEVGVFAKDFMKKPTIAPSTPKVWKTLSANHIVALSKDYKKLADFYRALFEMPEGRDGGRDVYQWFGDTMWIPTAVREGGKSSPELKSLDHVAYTIANYDSTKVYAELVKQKMIEPDDRQVGSLGINCKDVNGFKTQICDIKLVPKPGQGGI